MYLNSMGDEMAVTASSAPLSFNSTKYPGVCKPSDVRTLEVFKTLQRQLNRVAHGKGLTKIGVDGDIGPGTTGLMAKAGMAAAGTPCTAIAVAASAFAAQAKQIADQLGVASVVSGPSAGPSTLVSATGVEVAAPPSSVLDILGNMSTVEKVAAVGILGGIGYFVLNKKKRKGRR